MHSHAHYEIVVYEKGSGIFQANEKQIPCSVGDIIIVPPGVIHASGSEEEIERIYIGGDFHQIFNLTSVVVVSEKAGEEGCMLARMIYNNRFSNPEYVGALIHCFTLFLLQNIDSNNEMHDAVQSVIDAIAENFYDCHFNVCTLLKKSGYAEDYIRAQFKKVTGKTPTEFLTEVRIHHACYLIDTYQNSLPLSIIAEKCGYTDYIYFSRRFKQVVGLSPRQYMLHRKA